MEAQMAFVLIRAILLVGNKRIVTCPPLSFWYATTKDELCRITELVYTPVLKPESFAPLTVSEKNNSCCHKKFFVLADVPAMNTFFATPAKLLQCDAITHESNILEFSRHHIVSSARIATRHIS
jgi:hypothetical protein